MRRSLPCSRFAISVTAVVADHQRSVHRFRQRGNVDRLIQHLQRIPQLVALGDTFFGVEQADHRGYSWLGMDDATLLGKGRFFEIPWWDAIPLQYVQTIGVMNSQASVLKRGFEMRLLSDDRPPCGRCVSICDECPPLSVRERLERIPWQSLKRMDEIAFSKRRHVAAASGKAKPPSEEPKAGVDPDDYPDVYLTNWYGVSYAAICFTKNMEGTLNLIMLIAMGKLGLRNQADIEAWIDGHLKSREEGMPPSMNVAPIPGFEKILGGEAMQALGTSLAFWIDAAILRQYDAVHVAWPSLMQAQLHLGRAMGPVTARELVSNAAAAKEKEELKAAVLNALAEIPDKSLPTLYIAILKVMINVRVKKAKQDEKMDDEKLYRYLEYGWKKIDALRSAFIRVTNKTSRGAPNAGQRKEQEIILSEIMESEPGVYDVLRKKIDKYKREI